MTTLIMNLPLATMEQILFTTITFSIQIGSNLIQISLKANGIMDNQVIIGVTTTEKIKTMME